MLSGRPPFQGKSVKDLDHKILTGKLILPSMLTSASHSLLKGLLERDVNKRLGASKSCMFEVAGVMALKEHDFFAGLDWQRLSQRDYTSPLQLSIQQQFVSITLPVNGAVTTTVAQITSHFHVDCSSQVVRPSIVEDCIGHLLPPITESTGHSSNLNSTATSASRSFQRKPSILSESCLCHDQEEVCYADFEYHSQEFLSTTTELYEQFLEQLPKTVRKIQGKRHARLKKKVKKVVLV